MALYKPFSIDQARRNPISPLREYTISLSTLRNWEEVTISGDFFHVLDCTGSCFIKINEQEAPELDMNRIKKINIPFYRIFVKNTAQTSSYIKLLIGQGASFYFEERRTSIEPILSKTSETLTVLDGSTSYTLDLSGYKNVSVYFKCDKNATVLLWTYPKNASILTDYQYSDQVGLVSSNRIMNRVIDHPIGAIQIAIYNEDTADTMTYTLVVQGEK